MRLNAGTWFWDFFFAQKAELNFRLPDIGYFFMLHFSFLFLCFFPSSFFHFLSFFLVLLLFPLFPSFFFLPVPLSLFSFLFFLFSCFTPLSLVFSFPFSFALSSFFLCFSLSFSLFLSLFFPSEIQNKFKIINPSSHSVYRKAYAYIPISSSLWIEPLYRNLRTTMLNFPGFRVEFVPASYALL